MASSRTTYDDDIAYASQAPELHDMRILHMPGELQNYI